MTGTVAAGGLAIACMVCAVFWRIALFMKEYLHKRSKKGEKAGIAQTNGNKEIQADRVCMLTNEAGTMAVIADGIGNANTGAVCAQLAVDTLLDRYEPYHVLTNPEYFFKTSFYEANCRIQKTIGERRGGASLAAVFTDGVHMHYAVAGDIRIALFRGGELIPLSKGQTLNILAAEAYQDGKITRQEAIWSMEERRIWNYVGMDGFKEIEICEKPIFLRQGDQVLMLSKGIFEELSWSELEDILFTAHSVQLAAEAIIEAVKKKANQEKENGSVMLLNLTMEAVHEKD